jgi:hypothetical protein
MKFNGDLSQQQFCEAHVRFGSKADIGAPPIDVRFTPKADIAESDRHVRFVPIADEVHCSKELLFDHLVGERKD